MIVELSSGHVFAAGSVKSIGPFFDDAVVGGFWLYGVGFEICISEDYPDFIGSWEKTQAETNKIITKLKALRQEAIDKLLAPSQTPILQPR